MTAEDRLREKLRKIEALFAGAATPGERAAAGAAAERIRLQFETASKTERLEEFKFSPIPGPGNCSRPYAEGTALGHFATGGCTARPC